MHDFICVHIKNEIEFQELISFCSFYKINILPENIKLWPKTNHLAFKLHNKKYVATFGVLNLSYQNSVTIDLDFGKLKELLNIDESQILKSFKDLLE
jgi:hypothetical protein